MDKGILNILAPIGGMGLIVVLILWIVAMVKEPKITGYYKFLNIYGRIYAYFAVDMLFAGFAATVMGIIMIFEVITGHGSVCNRHIYVSPRLSKIAGFYEKTLLARFDD